MKGKSLKRNLGDCLIEQFEKSKIRFSKNSEPIQIVLGKLSVLTRNITKEMITDDLNFDEKIMKYKRILKNRLNDELEAKTINAIEKEILIGVINEVTCPETYRKFVE